MKPHFRLLVLAVVAAIAMSTPALFGQRSTPRPTKKDLPVAVHDVFVRTYPRATIKKWTQDSKDGLTWYDVESTDAGRFRHVLYREDGTVLEVRDLLTPGEVPDSVRTAIAIRFPQSKILRLEKRVAGTTVHYYAQVRKKNRKHVELTLDESGSILK